MALLRALLQIKYLEGYSLAGGSALAVHLSHRESRDIDLFGQRDLDPDLLLKALEEVGQIEERTRGEKVFQCVVNQIPVDIVTYPYPLLEKELELEGFRILNLPDLAAMKLSAISRRGTKRDFVDLYFLLKRYPLLELIGFFKKRYPKGNTIHLLRSLVYFEDAESDPMPKMLIKITWDEVKIEIIKQVKAFDVNLL